MMARRVIAGRRSGVPWTPEQITTALWLDAADANTITESGGAVSQWDDKSPSALTFSQSVTASRPSTGVNTLGGKNVLTLDSANDECLIAGDDLDSVWTSDGWEVFYLCRVSVIIGTFNTVLSKVGDSNQSENERQFGVSLRDLGGYQSAQLYTTFSLLGNSDAQIVSATDTVSANTYYMFSTAYDKTAAPNGTTANTTARVQHVIDGSSQTEVVTFSDGSLGDIQDGAARLAVGANVGSSGTVYGGAYGGDIAEILVLPSISSAANRQRIEGYLAHKWGLAANLPSNHPYKNAAPRV